MGVATTSSLPADESCCDGTTIIAFSVFTAGPAGAADHQA